MIVLLAGVEAPNFVIARNEAIFSKGSADVKVLRFFFYLVMMKITYDAEVDAMYIQLIEAKQQNFKIQIFFKLY